MSISFSKYEKLENDIVDVFTKDENGNAIVQNFDIKPLPDFETDYRPQMPRPQVFVWYNDSDFAENETIGIVRQDEKLKVCIEIHSKSRRGEKGVMAIFETVRKMLIGYKFLGYDKFTLIQLAPSEKSGANQWAYTAVFSTSTKIAECLPDPDLIGNVLKEAKFAEP